MNEPRKEWRLHNQVDSVMEIAAVLDAIEDYLSHHSDLTPDDRPNQAMYLLAQLRHIREQL